MIDLAPIGTRHAATVARLGRLIDAAPGIRVHIRSQNPLRLGDSFEPEPDLLVVTWREDFYARPHPVGANVRLLIEVADSTLRYGTQIKVLLYARHGVPEVWIIDLEGGQLMRYRQPQGEGYTLVDVMSRPGVLVPDAAPELVLDLSGLPLNL